MKKVNLPLLFRIINRIKSWFEAKTVGWAIRILSKHIFIYPNVRMEMQAGNVHGGKINLTITGKNGVKSDKIFSELIKRIGE